MKLPKITAHRLPYDRGAWRPSIEKYWSGKLVYLQAWNFQVTLDYRGGPQGIMNDLMGNNGGHMKFITIYAAKPPRTYRRILFKYGGNLIWAKENWRCNFQGHRFIRCWHWNVITPFLRFTKCNGKIEFGLGNHYFEFGW